MQLLLFFVGVLSLLAVVVLVPLKVQARARARFAEVTRTRLRRLLQAVEQWTASAYDLVPYDSDQIPRALECPWRTIEVRLDTKTTWLLHIDQQERYRIGRKQGDAEVWYPSRYGWSEEVWLKQAVDLLLFRIVLLPPPRTYEESIARTRRDWAARLAAIEAELEAHASEGSVPDDGMDDMD